MNNITFRTFSSDDKTDTSYQKPLKYKLINDMKKLKNLSFLKQLERINSFHHNSLKNSLNTNYNYFKFGKEKLKTSDSTIIPKTKIFPPLDLYNNYNNSPIKNSTLSIGSISTIHNYTTRNNILNNSQCLSERKYNKTRNKIKYLQRFNYSLHSKLKVKSESIDDLKKKIKKIYLSNIIYSLQENEYKNIQEERNIAIDLMNLQILNYEKMIHLIKLYIEADNNYLSHLYKKIEIEKEKREDLFEKRNEVLHETYLLRHRFGRLQRRFEFCLNNKFFLLCVKNKTSLFDKFSEEDKKDYQIDIRSLHILSNFNSIQNQFNKKVTISIKGSEKRYSILEENISNGIRIIREPRIIFSSPQEFKKKLDIISFNIKNSLMIYNEKQDELTLLRENLKEKQQLIQKDEELEKFFNEEMSVTVNKLKEVKLRNEYLKEYLNNLPRDNNDNNLNLVDLKVIEIYNKINKKEEFKKKIHHFNEKVNTLSRLLEIENKINDLIHFKIDQEKNNYDKYCIVKKNIDYQNRIKANKLAKLKSNKDFQEKLRKIIEKSGKYIYQPYRKVNELFYIAEKKKSKSKEK